MSSSFDPLNECQGLAAQPRGKQITNPHDLVSKVAVDVAPYVRSIITYDVRLEQQRLALSNLLSQGGRRGKRQRTTRSSRAALEGGSKAHTRRERWFPKKLNFALALKTGGDGWNGLESTDTKEEVEADRNSARSGRSSMATTDTEA